MQHEGQHGSRDRPITILLFVSFLSTLRKSGIKQGA